VGKYNRQEMKKSLEHPRRNNLNAIKLCTKRSLPNVATTPNTSNCSLTERAIHDPSPFLHILKLFWRRTLHDGSKQGIDQQIFDRKSISHKIIHPQPWNLQAKLARAKKIYSVLAVFSQFSANFEIDTPGVSTGSNRSIHKTRDTNENESRARDGHSRWGGPILRRKQSSTTALRAAFPISAITCKHHGNGSEDLQNCETGIGVFSSLRNFRQAAPCVSKITIRKRRNGWWLVTWKKNRANEQTMKRYIQIKIPGPVCSASYSEQISFVKQKAFKLISNDQ